MKVKEMKSKHWLIGWLIIVCIVLGAAGGWVYKIDPYMHYHKPDTDHYFYKLDNQRSQNDGIIKHFEYDALITGSSMTENIRSSEMDRIFDCKSIKVPYSGATYKEINDGIKTAAEHNPKLKLVVRSLDMSRFFDDKDYMRRELGRYPTYLYDSDPINDVQYLWNRDAFLKCVDMATQRNEEGFEAGITSFDDYSRWQEQYTFGVNAVYADGVSEAAKGEAVHLTEEEKERIKGNITQNVTHLAKENPGITFYCFFTPYSAEWWKECIASGNIYKQIEAEQLIIELILECDNIKLFSFNNRLDITTDLNHYRDITHYGEWVNSLMLRWMHDGEYQLTKENYLEYLETEVSNYLSFDYDSLNGQVDYENDYYAAALLNEELTGAVPIKLSDMSPDELRLSNASIIEDQHDGLPGIECVGRLECEPGNDTAAYHEIVNGGYIGAELEIPRADGYGYLVFYGRRAADHGQPVVYVLNDAGEKVGELVKQYSDLDNEWQQYVVKLAEVSGKIKIILNGGYIDRSGSADSTFIFSDITLY